MPLENDSSVSNINRRRLLQGLGATGAAGLAGCFGGDDGDDEENGGPDIEQALEREEVDPSDIEEGGTFRAAIASGPDSFDYAYSSSAHATILMNLLYEGMTATDSDGKIYPWLAESYEQVDVQDVAVTDYEDYMITAEYNSDGVPQVDEQIVISHPDNDPSSGEGQFLTVAESADPVADGVYGMHYRFDLHQGVQFHDGEELTADNVVSSYGRIENSDLSGQLFDSLLHIEAEGDYTVHLYAQVPDASAIRELGGWPIFPSATVDLPAGAMDPRQGNTPLGTGPFALDEFEAENFVTFTRNDNYWFDTEMKDWFDGPSEFPNGPVVDEVDVRFVSEDSSRVAAVRNGEIDMTYDLPSNTLTDFLNSEDYRTAAARGAGYTFMQYPVQVAPFDDPKVRRAVNHLIPRNDISNNIFSGWEAPAWVPMPPIAADKGTTDYDQLVDDLKQYNEYNPDRAEELIEEAGVETPVDVTIRTNADDSDRVKSAELMVQAMNRTDVFEASVETESDINALVVQALDPEYYKEGELLMVGLSAGFNPHGYAKAVHHPDNFAQCCNFQNINDQELNELLESARYGVEVAQDPDLRRQRYDEVWKRVVELNANSYTTHSMTVSVLGGEVNGFNTYPSTQDIIGYGLFTPMDQQITYVSRD